VCVFVELGCISALVATRYDTTARILTSHSCWKFAIVSAGVLSGCSVVANDDNGCAMVAVRRTERPIF
jgi:hypothetical protein